MVGYGSKGTAAEAVRASRPWPPPFSSTLRLGLSLLLSTLYLPSLPPPTMDVVKAIETYVTKIVSVPSSMKVLLLDAHTVRVNTRGPRDALA